MASRASTARPKPLLEQSFKDEAEKHQRWRYLSVSFPKPYKNRGVAWGVKHSRDGTEFGSGNELRKELKEFPTLLMDLPSDSDLVSKVKDHRKKLKSLADE